jgi:chromosome segregation ATPase
MAANLTKAQLAAEDYECAKGLLAAWRRKGDAAVLADKVAEQQGIIHKAEDEIARVRDEYARAPGEIAKLEKKLKGARQNLALKTGGREKKVEKLETLLARAAKLQAEIEQAAAEAAVVEA